MEEGGCDQLTQKKIEEDAINGEERVGGEYDEEFYEQIEAPKFVDFTLPDSFRPDDRYWFCSRVGCDRKHEEVIDPDEISKNFVLRVMAARSPNIKLRRALNAKCSGMNMKCPLSAPAKSSKPRILRVAMVSSISHKLVEPKEKVGAPSSKFSSTPNAKSKQVAAKYMTTPRRKKSLPASNSFPSVQNPKPTSVLVPKNRLVAKALLFHSPKKGISVKRSVELHASITKICEGMKRLEITSQKKQILSYSSKPSKAIKSSSKKPFPKDHSGRRVSFLKRRRVSFLKVKRPSKESMPPQKCKDQEMKSSRGFKTNGKKILTNQCKSTTKQTAGHGSNQCKSTTNEEEHQPTLGITESSSSDDAKILKESASRKASQSLLSDVFRAETKLSQNVEEKSGYQTLQDSGLINNDDKENVLTSDVNRDNNCDNKQSGKKVLGSQETLKNKKMERVGDKNLKDCLLPATTGPVLVRYKKPKLTNPKPFRLRTDERGILKEANLDRKLHFPAPQNEAGKDSAFSAGNSKRKNVKASDGSCQKNEPTPKVSIAIHREPKSATPKSENSLMRTRSPYLREKLVMPQRIASTKRANASYVSPSQRLGAITETLKSTKPAKEENVDGTVSITNTGSASSAPRPTSRLKRPITIPKEPIFQSSHVPKTCTRRNVTEISVLS